MKELWLWDEVQDEETGVAVQNKGWENSYAKLKRFSASITNILLMSYFIGYGMFSGFLNFNGSILIFL